MERKTSIIFWTIISVLLWIIFGRTSGNYIYSFYFLVFFVPVVIITSQVFNKVIIPRYLLKKKYGLFALYTFYAFIISLDVELVLIFIAFILISAYDFHNMPAIIDSYKWMPVLMYFIVILYSFIIVVVELMRKPDFQGSEGYFTVRSERKTRRLKYEEVSYIESMSDYLKIFLVSGEVVITRERIGSLSEALPGQFLRIHRSFIVNTQHINSFNREEVTMGEVVLPLSRTYKKEALQALEATA